jgi:hypothetical protein
LCFHVQLSFFSSVSYLSLQLLIFAEGSSTIECTHHPPPTKRAEVILSYIPTAWHICIIICKYIHFFCSFFAIPLQFYKIVQGSNFQALLSHRAHGCSCFQHTVTVYRGRKKRRT